MVSVCVTSCQFDVYICAVSMDPGVDLLIGLV